MEQPMLRRLADLGVEMRFTAKRCDNGRAPFWSIEVTTQSGDKLATERITNAQGRPRRWRQLSAIVAFIQRHCGEGYELTITT